MEGSTDIEVIDLTGDSSDEEIDVVTVESNGEEIDVGLEERQVSENPIFDIDYEESSCDSGSEDDGVTSVLPGEPKEVGDSKNDGETSSTGQVLNEELIRIQVESTVATVTGEESVEATEQVESQAVEDSARFEVGNSVAAVAEESVEVPEVVGIQAPEDFTTEQQPEVTAAFDMSVTAQVTDASKEPNDDISDIAVSVRVRSGMGDQSSEETIGNDDLGTGGAVVSSSTLTTEAQPISEETDNAREKNKVGDEPEASCSVPVLNGDSGRASEKGENLNMDEGPSTAPKKRKMEMPRKDQQKRALTGESQTTLNGQETEAQLETSRAVVAGGAHSTHSKKRHASSSGSKTSEPSGESNEDKKEVAAWGSAAGFCGKNHWSVEKVLNHRFVQDDTGSGHYQYLIKWENWENEYNSWEPEKNLNCNDRIDTYLKSRLEKMAELNEPEPRD